MSRRLQPPPANMILVKTSRGTWIALLETWDGEELVDVSPMRTGHDGGGAIVQKSERRGALAQLQIAQLNTELERAREEIRRLGGDGGRDARAMSGVGYGSRAEDARQRVS